MSGKKIFLDTNIILYLLAGDKTLATFLHEKQLFISVITELELLGYGNLEKKEETAIKNFIAECSVVNINSRIKELTIDTRKKYKNKLPDSIIMASSMYLGLPLLSADSDFKKVQELSLIHYEK